VVKATTTMVKVVLTVTRSDGQEHEYTFDRFTSKDRIPFTLYTVYKGFSTDDVDYNPITLFNAAEFRRKYPLFTLKIPHTLALFEQILANSDCVNWVHSSMSVFVNEDDEGEVFYFDDETITECIEMLRTIITGFSVEEFDIDFIIGEDEDERKVPYDDRDLSHRILIASVVDDVYRQHITFAAFKMVELVSPNANVTTRDLVALNYSVMSKTADQKFHSVKIGSDTVPLLHRDEYRDIMRYFMMFAMFPIRERISCLLVTNRHIMSLIQEARDYEGHIEDVLGGRRRFFLNPSYARALQRIIDHDDTTGYIRLGYASHLDRAAEEHQ
jgi:hypothetical protein